MPSPSKPGAKPSDAKGEPGDSKDEQGAETASTSKQEEREKAAGDLKEAGQKVADAGAKVGETGSPGSSEPPELPATAEAAPGDSKPDPLLIQDPDATQASEEIVFSESEAQAANSAESEAAESSAASGGAESQGAESSASGSESTTAQSGQSSSGGGDSGDELDEAIRAAQEALIEAGITLERAGDAVQSAESEEDMAAAREILAEARIIIIVASHDLEAAREAAGDTDSRVFDEAEQALDEATIAIVVATGAVEGLPDFEDMQSAGVGTGNGTLDDELEESLIVFEGQILEARRTVLIPSIPGTAEGLPRGTPADLPEGSPSEAEEDPEAPTQTTGSNSEGSVQMTGREEATDLAQLPEDIGDGQDDDIVAQQLREAAIAETDPKLRDKLWEEYKRYKSGR